MLTLPWLNEILTCSFFSREGMCSLRLGSLSQLQPVAWQPWTKTFCISQECTDLTVAFLYWLGFMLNRREGELGLQLCVCAFRTAWSRTSYTPLSQQLLWPGAMALGQCRVGKVETQQSCRSRLTEELRGWSGRQDQGRAGDEDLVSALLSPH